MSYILEALRRSEQERSRGETPDVTTQHELPPLRTVPGGPRSRFAWLLGGALLANAIVLALWLLPDRSGTNPDLPSTSTPGVAPNPPLATRPRPSADSAPAPTTPATATDIDVITARAREPAATVPAAGPAVRAAEDAVREAAVAGSTEETASARAAASVTPSTAADTEAEEPEEIATPATVEPAAPVAIRDLPERIQRSIPTLEFATHIFGDAPRYREVTINGRRYAEGERVEGMLLAEITETGVVFDYQGYRFEVGVLEDWDY